MSYELFIIYDKNSYIKFIILKINHIESFLQILFED